MIIKVFDSLRTLLLSTPEDFEKPNDGDEQPWRPVVVDKGLPTRVHPNKSSGYNSIAPSYLKELVPQWLTEAVAEGSFVVMPKEDYFGLDEQVREYMEIVSSR